MKDSTTKDTILKVVGVFGGIGAFCAGCAVASDMWQKHLENKWIDGRTGRQIGRHNK